MLRICLPVAGGNHWRSRYDEARLSGRARDSVLEAPIALPSDPSLVLPIAAALWIPLLPLGLLLLQAGMSRIRNTAHTLLMGLAGIALAIVGFLLPGAWIAGAGAAGHGFWLAGHFWDLIGRHAPWSALAAHPAAALQAWQELWAAAIVALLALAGGLERWRRRPAMLAAYLCGAFFLPLMAHWLWGQGWLAQAPALFHLRNAPVDPAGAGGVQLLGGLIALSVMIQLGPRRGKFPADGLPAALPAHNIPLVLLSCLLLLPGWLAWNLLGALLHPQPFAAISAMTVAVNTVLPAAGGLLAAFELSAWRFGKPDASLSANGWLAGLVASSAGCALWGPLAALITGAVAGALVVFTVELIELRARLDDPAGVLPTHLLAGIWGVLAVALFGRNLSRAAQLLELAVLIAFFWPLSFAALWLIGRLAPHRLDPDDERRGLDLSELGAGAYPEFVTHDDAGF